MEETGKNRPRKKGEKGMNFLSIKTPLEREATVFVIGHPRGKDGRVRALSGAGDTHRSEER